MSGEEKSISTEIDQRPSITALSQPISRRYKTPSWLGTDCDLSRLRELDGIIGGQLLRSGRDTEASQWVEVERGLRLFPG